MNVAVLCAFAHAVGAIRVIIHPKVGGYRRTIFVSLNERLVQRQSHISTTKTANAYQNNDRK
jgi:hypothetical protein